MFGRGTRIAAATGKLMFRVYDYTNATRLFGEDFITQYRVVDKPSTDDEEEDDEETTCGGDAEHPVSAEGITVQIRGSERLIPTAVDGKQVLLTVEEYKRQLA